MGTWGSKIKQDDIVLDVIDSFTSNLKLTQDPEKATRETLKGHALEMRDAALSKGELPLGSSR